MYRMLIVCCAIALALGCSKGEDKKKGEGEKPKKPAPAAGVDLGHLGLTGDAPAGTKARKMGKSVMVQGTDLVVTVGIAGSFDAADIAAATKEAKSNKATNIKSTKLADGFLVTYENKGSAGTNYWVEARRKIGGKDYACKTTASKPAQQANAAKFCKSLKKK